MLRKPKMTNITKVKPAQKARVGNLTIQVYADGKVSVGELTGKKPGPHFRGLGKME